MEVYNRDVFVDFWRWVRNLGTSSGHKIFRTAKVSGETSHIYLQFDPTYGVPLKMFMNKYLTFPEAKIDCKLVHPSIVQVDITPGMIGANFLLEKNPLTVEDIWKCKPHWLHIETAQANTCV